MDRTSFLPTCVCRHQISPILGAPKVGTVWGLLGPSKKVCLCPCTKRKTLSAKCHHCKPQDIWLWVVLVKGHPFMRNLWSNSKWLPGLSHATWVGSSLSSAGPLQHIPNSPPWILGAAPSTFHTLQGPHRKEMVYFSHYLREPFPWNVPLLGHGIRCPPWTNHRKAQQLNPFQVFLGGPGLPMDLVPEGQWCGDRHPSVL